MTDLVFPGGVVRIDESQVWKSMMEWLKRTPTRHVSKMSDVAGECYVELRESLPSSDYECWTGYSRLGLGDALAQALQKAHSRPVKEPTK